MASDLISRGFVMLDYLDRLGRKDSYKAKFEALCEAVDNAPAVDAVEVVRCKDCVYWRDRHVLTPDGKRKSYAEMPPEAFVHDSCLDGAVTIEYGINCGSRCEINGDSDEAVFREAGDFCSRGVRKYAVD